MNSVLVVDDDPAIANLLGALLIEEGFNAITATSGQQALEIVSANPPDLVLLDLMMPKVSGSAICIQLKADPLTRHIPVIIISGDAKAAQKVLEIGADGLISKPFDLDEVLACVAEKVNAHGGGRELEVSDVQASS